MKIRVVRPRTVFLITIGMILSSSFTTSHASRAPRLEDNTVEVLKQELNELKQLLTHHEKQDSNSNNPSFNPMP